MIYFIFQFALAFLGLSTILIVIFFSYIFIMAHKLKKPVKATT